jgi:hypothetical protein
MRRTLAIVIALLLAITLLPACGPGGEDGTGGGGGAGGNETPPGDTTYEYTGFMAAAAGQWADYVTGEGFHEKMEYIGEDTVDGESCVGFEMTRGEPEAIMQMWTSVATGQLVKYVVKAEGEVMCWDPGYLPFEPPASDTPDEYSPDLSDITYGTYTVPGNGETIGVAIFASTPGSEVWVSSEVSFGMVNTTASGITTMYLYDFGTSGAVRDISAAEMENCTPIPSL